MARVRRRSSGSRPRADWVYRPNGAGGGSPINMIDSMGTYENSVRSLTSGFAGAQVLWLYDAKNRQIELSRQSTAAFSALPGTARAEGRRPLCLAVEGSIYVEPSTWAVGNLMAVGMRIGAYEQDAVTGLASLDADQTMWAGAVTAQPAALWANDRRYNVWESRHWKGFSDNQIFMVVHVRARFRISLSAQMGLGLYLESASTAVNTRYQTWLRTKVVDDS